MGQSRSKRFSVSSTARAMTRNRDVPRRLDRSLEPNDRLRRVPNLGKCQCQSTVGSRLGFCVFDGVRVEKQTFDDNLGMGSVTSRH